MLANCCQLMHIYNLITNPAVPNNNKISFYAGNFLFDKWTRVKYIDFSFKYKFSTFVEPYFLKSFLYSTLFYNKKFRNSFLKEVGSQKSLFKKVFDAVSLLMDELELSVRDFQPQNGICQGRKRNALLLRPDFTFRVALSAVPDRLFR